MDFTLRHRQTGRIYPAEMKCWITWENYRYLRLIEARQLRRVKEPAFLRFLALARHPSAYNVFVNRKLVEVDGTILIWGATTPGGKAAAASFGIDQILTVEDMVSNLRAWRPTAWHQAIALRRAWAAELFDYLD